MENSRKNYCKGNKQRRKKYVRKERKGEREREDSEGERVKFVTEGIEGGGERKRVSVRESKRGKKI